MIDVRDNWRIYVLVVLCLLAGLALFLPSGDGPADDSEQAVESGMTNLRYGLDLAGGTRLRAAMVGLTAEDVPMSSDQHTEIGDTVWRELDLEPIDVVVRQTSQDSGIVEVHANVSESAFRDALEAADVDTSGVEIRQGVTAETRQTAVDTLRDRINQAGLSGGSATTVSSATGEHFAVIEVPGANRSQVLDLIGDPGRVQLVAEFPESSGNGTEYRREPLLEQGDFSDISTPDETPELGPHVPVELTPEAGERFQSAMNEYGFTTAGVESCRYRTNPNDPGYCLYTIVDDEIVHSSSMGRDLASSLQSGDFMETGRNFVIQTGNLSEANELHLHLRAGALPTDLDIQSASFVAPSIAEEFKTLALVTGIFTWILVSLVVYWRYREPKVAVPMLLTAGTEVFLLLGFAAAIGLPLDLAHIAGFIAVIGTGVDDLIIIADEILQRGTVATDRVFRNRFRKAFWVIGAAAATTILAMSPLAILSLGDLQGFAIVTIVGVLVGVLITRPAYGDVLRNLLLVEETE